MTFKTLMTKLHKLGYTAENLEPSELNVISLNPKQTVLDSNFPKEFDSVDLNHLHQFYVEHNVSDKLFLLVKHFADTPIKSRHIPNKFYQ